MSTVADALTALVRQAAVAAGHAEAPVPLEPCVPTQDPRHGDYQSNFAFRLGKALRTNPREVAELIRAHLPADPMVASTEVAGPGFLNFTLDDAWLARELVRRAADPRFDGPVPGEGKALVIDYSSPNIAKRMHVGHMRSTIIGNALDRIFRYLGYDVVADNHLGDWGTPFGMLIVAWRTWRDDAAYAADPVGELQRLYQLFRAEEKERPELSDHARAETARLQAGDPDNRALWEQFVTVSMQEFDEVYRRLDVTFDVALGESAYDGMLADTVATLFDKGLAEEDHGAAIVRFSAEDGKGLKDKVLVVRKSDGAATYGTTDVATVTYRMARWNPARIVYVTDVRQRQHFQQIFAIAGKLGIHTELEHVYFGMLRFADGSVAATRGGSQLVNLVDVLDEARDRARAVVDTRADDIPDEAERAAIAEAVGIGAVKYADLSQNPQSDVVFEWDKMLALQGNTAPYLMYAHARCASLLRTAAARGDAPGTLVLAHELERQLATMLVRLPDAIVLAGNTARPNLLCDHVFSLAQVFARFWDGCPVLRDDVTPDVRASRLALVQATAHGLRLGLGLLGIGTPDRM